jgi:hypothetical protein
VLSTINSARHLLIVGLFTAVAVSACGTYKDAIMEPWLGATQNELTQKWGYPQTANDVVKFDDGTTNFTYRSYRGGDFCLVSFTLKRGIVAGYKYEGGNCPRIER